MTRTRIGVVGLLLAWGCAEASSRGGGGDFGNGDDTSDGSDDGAPSDDAGSDSFGDDSDDGGDGGSDGGDPDTGGSNGDPDSGGGSDDSGGSGDAGGCPGGFKMWYLDGDGDGYGTDADSLGACTQPAGYADNQDDCDDDNAAVNPGEEEQCDLLDNDCNAVVDELSPGNTVCNGCALGERGGHFYYYCDFPLNHASAQATCETFGADLVKIGDALENNFLLGEPLPAAPGIWIGANDIVTEGSFVWQDGDAVGFANWQVGEPNNANGNEDCAAWAGGLWNDVPCFETTFRSICEAIPQ